VHCSDASIPAVRQTTEERPARCTGHRWRRLAAVAVVLTPAAGCVVVEPAPPVVVSPGMHDPALHIPPGHMPAPGQCRIWFADRPPGQQPPPGDCDELQQRVPPGAYLVHG
jgi:hypothetical protein